MSVDELVIVRPRRASGAAHYSWFGLVVEGQDLPGHFARLEDALDLRPSVEAAYRLGGREAAVLVLAGTSNESRRSVATFGEHLSARQRWDRNKRGPK